MLLLCEGGQRRYTAAANKFGVVHQRNQPVAEVGEIGGRTAIGIDTGDQATRRTRGRHGGERCTQLRRREVDWQWQSQAQAQIGWADIKPTDPGNIGYGGQLLQGGGCLDHREDQRQGIHFGRADSTVGYADADRPIAAHPLGWVAAGGNPQTGAAVTSRRRHLTVVDELPAREAYAAWVAGLITEVRLPEQRHPQRSEEQP